MPRIAIIGAGRIGQVHARAVAAHPEAELAGICDPIERNAQALAASFGTPYWLSPDEVFANPEVDAVIIGSPTGFHVAHVLAAVEAGKRVLCEKPIALDLTEARNCISKLGDVADEVMMGFNRRFDPTFSEIRQRVAAGEIGTLQQLTIISRDSEAPPAGYVAGSGGIFKDMTIHDLDMARFFLGDIVEVSAVGTNFEPEIAEQGDFDQVMVTLKAANGAMANIINTRTCVFGYDQRLEAFGSDGALSADNLTATAVRKAGADLTEGRSRVMDFFLDRYQAAYSRELDAFLRSADGVPTIRDGLQALLLAEAALDSARQGKVVQV